SGSQVCQGKGGAYWDRLFNAFGSESNELTSMGIGPGWIIEAVRLFVALGIALIFMPSLAFQDAAGLLMTRTPLRRWFGGDDVPPSGELEARGARFGFGVLVFLGLVFTAVVVGHHLITGPEYLWRTKGLLEGPGTTPKAPQEAGGTPD